MVNYVFAYLQTLLARDEEEGQGLVEYALIIVLVSIATIAALQAITGGINTVFNSIAGTLTGGV